MFRKSRAAQVDPRRKRGRQKWRRRLIAWLFFGALLGLVPIVVEGFLRGDWPHVIESGSVFLVSTVICGAAIGEVVAADVRPSLKTTSIAITGFCVLAMVMSIVFYAAIVSGHGKMFDLKASAISFSAFLIVGGFGTCVAAIEPLLPESEE